MINEGTGRQGRKCPVNCGNDAICSHGGTVIWVTPSRARVLLDLGAVELLNPPKPVGPKETKPAAPEEIKQESTEKKSFPADQDGPLTDLAQSTESGTAEQQSSSAEGQALPQPKPKRQYTRRKKAGQE